MAMSLTQLEHVRVEKWWPTNQIPGNFAYDGELLRVMITNGNNNMHADFEMHDMINPHVYVSRKSIFGTAVADCTEIKHCQKTAFYLDQNSDECHLETLSVQSQRRDVVWSQIGIYPKDCWVESKQHSFNNF